MDFIKDQKDYFIRIDRGEEIFATLLQLAKKEEWPCAHLSGIGAVNNIELGTYAFSDKEYKKDIIPGDRELLSLDGNMSFVDNAPFFHIHGVLADSNYKCMGGHFFSATVAVTCEIILRPYPIKIERSFSKEIGINLLNFCKLN